MSEFSLAKDSNTNSRHSATSTQAKVACAKKIKSL